jgi:hypothetical protein
MAENKRKAELTAELARARSRIGLNLGALRRDLDFPARAKRAVFRHPRAWVGGASLIGLLLARLPSRKKAVPAGRKNAEAQIVGAGKAGLLLGALKIAFDLSRPALAKWAGQRVTDYMGRSKKDGRISR